MTALEFNLDSFLATGNPIYAWWAYKWARDMGEPIPDAVLEYLDSAAAGINAISAKPPEQPKQRLKKVAKALRLDSKSFTDYHKEQRHGRFIRLLEESYFLWLDKYGDDPHGWEDSELKSLSEQASISKSTGKRLFDKFMKRRKILIEKKVSDLPKRGTVFDK